MVTHMATHLATTRMDTALILIATIEAIRTTVTEHIRTATILRRHTTTGGRNITATIVTIATITTKVM
jgi:cytidylate kinase